MSPLGWFVVAINAVGFLAMAVDKLFAMRRQRRLPEAHLLGIAALGGAVGVWAGLMVIRHKSRKVSFQRMLVLASLVNVVWLYLWHRM